MTEKQRKGLAALVDFLQEYTDTYDRVDEYSDEKTELNPEGDYARIERWLSEQMDGQEEMLEQFANIRI